MADDAEDIDEGTFEDESSDGITAGQINAGSTPKRSPVEHNPLGRDFQVVDEVLVDRFDVLVGALFGGAGAVALAVAAIVVGDDAIARLMKRVEGVADHAEVLGVAMAVEQHPGARGVGRGVKGEGFGLAVVRLGKGEALNLGVGAVGGGGGQEDLAIAQKPTVDTEGPVGDRDQTQRSPKPRIG